MVLDEIANEIDVVLDHTPYDLLWNTGPFEALNGFQTPPVNWTINA